MVAHSGLTIAEVNEVTVSDRALSASDWGAIIGGALSAIAATIILFSAGSGFGLSTLTPWNFATHAPQSFAIAAGIWMIVMQWLSAALGGYMAGRLRTKWIGTRTDEVMFRDTAHGFLAWALATLLVAIFFTVGASVAGAALTAIANVPDAPSTANQVATQVSPADAEAARKVAANFSVFTAISLLIGGFIGAVAGAIGGYHRDA
jgi:hypothetical protein